MAAEQRFDIPPTRLPFVNAEFAQIETPGGTRLVSSIWGGHGNGRIFLIDPRNGACEMRRLPAGEPGAYMLQSGPGGRLYLGSGTGNLYRYDPQSDAFETLVKDEMHSITWGGCVTERYAVWSASPGEAGVYDWREGRLRHVLRPLDTERPEARYGHRVIETPDGKVLFGMNCPQARLIVLDPASGERRSVVPDGLDGQEWTRDATFFDEETLALFCGAELLFYRYPSFEPLGRTPPPEGVHGMGGRACFCGGRFYALSGALHGTSGSLHRLKPDRSGWELVREDFTGTGGILWPLDDQQLCALNTTGVFFRLDLSSGEVFTKELDANGPLGVHAFCPAPEIKKVFGAPFINQRFWRVDLASGEGADLGRAAPGGGQINGIVWDPATSRVLMASYTSCSITAFDPERPARWPENPRVIAKAGNGQMRPKALVHDGRHVWMASSAEYGHLGGALSRLDPRDGSLKVWRHLVKDQTPNAIVADPEAARVYVSTEIHADCQSAPSTQRSARLVAFDTERLAVARETAPLEDCPSLKVLAKLDAGRVLVLARGQLLAWRPEQDACVELGPAPKGLREVVAAPDGSLYTSAEGRVGRLRIGEGEGEAKSIALEALAEGAGRFLAWAEGRLWYVREQQVCALDLA